MRIQIQPSALKETTWYEYAIRFLFGGLITCMAGLIATKFGPALGGLFLAFPAIFPASATLIEKHERQKKQKQGLNGREGARKAAAIDACGSTVGSIGLIFFGGIVWIYFPRFNVFLVLVLATVAWFVASASCWALRKRF
jgi:Protein of unknown function (DUF3147)